MNIGTQILYYLLEALKWLILIRVLLSWLPMASIRLSSMNQAVIWLNRITDPILKPLRPFARMGMMDLSPIIAYFIILFFQSLLDPRQGYSIKRAIALAIVLLVAFSVHEFSHAWVAYMLGDPTAKNQGRLTLDPRKHLDVLGTVMVLFAGFGWAKPVPVNPYNLKNGPKAGMAMVAAAGPFSNLILAILASIPIRLGVVESVYSSSFFPNPQELFLYFVYLNIILVFFNLLPIAPLDGFKVLGGLLPYPTSQKFLGTETFGPLILMMLFFLIPRFFSILIMAPTDWVLKMLIPISAL